MFTVFLKSIHRLLDCFHSLAIVNSAAVTIRVQVSLLCSDLILVGDIFKPPLFFVSVTLVLAVSELLLPLPELGNRGPQELRSRP
jgi:hypothetical protein